MTGTAWDPVQYHQFADHRLRPALDLFSRIDVTEPALVHDVGCGRGDIARLAAGRWPSARVVGSDSSEDMLIAARAMPGRIEWIQLDVRDWDPPQPVDVIFANAVLHWVEEHDELLPAMVRSLAPGGVLAVQMPLTWDEPTHRLMRETLAGGGSGNAALGEPELRAFYGRRNVEQPSWYHGLLKPIADRIEVWATTYYQTLTGEHAVLEWVKGTALRPLLESLPPDDLERFMSRYRPALREAYPESSDGSTLYPIPRLFLLAHSAS
ncbi:MAG: methyltransferase domain-containing protein [Acidimicrobiia bacterium]